MTSLNSKLQLALLNRKKRRNILEKGFTLVELMVVIVIVGILSAVALPSLLGNKELAARNAARNVLATSAKACQAAIVGGDANLNPDMAQAKVPDADFSIAGTEVPYNPTVPTYAECIVTTTENGVTKQEPMGTEMKLAATPPPSYSKWKTIEEVTIQPGGQVTYCWTDSSCAEVGTGEG